MDLRGAAGDSAGITQFLPWLRVWMRDGQGATVPGREAAPQPHASVSQPAESSTATSPPRAAPAPTTTLQEQTAPTTDGSSSVGIWLLIGGSALVALALLRNRIRKRTARPPAHRSAGEAPDVEEIVELLGPVTTVSIRRSGPESPLASSSGSDLNAEGDAAWVPFGKAVRVGEWTLAGPAYVGGALRPAHASAERDNCLIDPSLPVAARPDTGGQFMDYWPSYERMKPSCRRALLEWMATSRSEPETYIGYVFVYFYGLERRAVLERSEPDRPLIREEVRRLLAIYGRNGSFHRYASELLSALELLDAGDRHDPDPVYEPAAGDVPASVKIAVGRRLKEGRPLEPERLLSLVMSHPETRVRTPARRAFPQLVELFRKECERRQPKGLLFDARGLPPARIVYRAASGTFVCDLTENYGAFPDASKHAAALAFGRTVLDACTERLDAYSRFVGKAPELAGCLHAMALLPPETRASLLEPGSESPAAWLHDQADRMAAVPVAELFKLMAGTVPERLTPARLKEAADTLAKFGAGLVPDPRFSIGHDANGEVLLFRLEQPVENLPEASAEYKSALLVLSLGMLVAKADGTIDQSERHALQSICEGVSVAASERRRLCADLRWLELHPLQLARLRGRLSMIAPAEREEIASLLVRVCAAGRVPQSAEVAILERIYRQLNLDPERLYRGLHRTADAAASADGPIRVVPAQPAAGFAVPRAPETVPTGTEKKFPRPGAPRPDRLQEIRAETQAVAAVLDRVFEQPEDFGRASDDSPVGKDDRTERLGPRELRLLHQLLARDTWPRPDFERLARELGLVPGAAMEELNAWAYEAHDDVLLEDGDPVRVNRELVIEQFAEAAE
jgi:uncharacterized tellurite resistance protein B-like protein